MATEWTPTDRTFRAAIDRTDSLLVRADVAPFGSGMEVTILPRTLDHESAPAVAGHPLQFDATGLEPLIAALTELRDAIVPETLEALEARHRALCEQRKKLVERINALTVRDPNRCAVCGWPLAGAPSQGCLRGQCAHRGQRPDFDRLYDPKRAVIERERLAAGQVDTLTDANGNVWDRHHVARALGDEVPDLWRNRRTNEIQERGQIAVAEGGER